MRNINLHISPRVVMHLFVVFAMSLLSLCASGQDGKGYGRMDASYNKAPLSKVLSDIERKFGCSVFFVHDEVKGYLVSRRVKSDNVRDAIGIALLGLPFMYRVEEDFVAVSGCKPALNVQEIRGRVTDSAGTPLQYATLEILPVEKGDKVMAFAAGEDGRFEVSNGGLRRFILQISYIGYTSYRVLMENVSEPIELGVIKLCEDSVSLPDVVITPDETQERADRIIIYPSESDVEETDTGMELVERLMFRKGVRVLTDYVVSEDQLARLNIQINGRKASLWQVRALRSSDIKNVVYLYAPSLFSGGYNRPYAINIITKERYGWSAEAVAAVSCSGGHLSVFAQFSAPRVTWGMRYAARRQREDVLKYDEQIEDVGRAEAFAGAHKVVEQIVELNGNLLVGSAGKLDVRVTNTYHEEPGSFVDRRFSSQGVAVHDVERICSKGHFDKPSVDATYNVKVGESGSLSAEVLGNMYFGRGSYAYSTDDSFVAGYDKERDAYDGGVNLSYEHSAEKWKYGVSAGYAFSFVRLDYTDVHVGTFDVSAAGSGYEWRNKFCFATATVGLSTSYTERRWTLHAKVDVMRQQYEHKSFLFLAPHFSALCRLGNKLNLVYALSAEDELPDAEMLPPFLLPVDAWSARYGNKGLKPQRKWYQRISAELKGENYSLELAANHRYVDSPIALLSSRNTVSGGILRRWENTRFVSDFYPSFKMNGQLVHEHLQFTVGGECHWSRNGFGDAGRGRVRHLELSYVKWDAELFGVAGPWRYGARIGTPERCLHGDVEVHLPDENKVYVSRKLGKFTLAAEWECPLGGNFAERREDRHGDAECGYKIFRMGKRWGDLLFSARWNL